jgi:hypothetical protein
LLRDPSRLQIISRALKALAVEIETLGADLCTDDAVVARHATKLQAFDSICQRQVALAELLAADNLESALNDCRLDRVAALFN